MAERAGQQRSRTGRSTCCTVSSPLPTAKPRSAALNPAIVQWTRKQGVVGNPQAGGAAVNLAGAPLAITISEDTKLRVYVQKRGRIRRPGQTKPVTYVDVLACGPKGQSTIDHHIAAALREASRTSRPTRLPRGDGYSRRNKHGTAHHSRALYRGSTTDRVLLRRLGSSDQPEKEVMTICMRCNQVVQRCQCPSTVGRIHEERPPQPRTTPVAPPLHQSKLIH
jgi:hypothetical protein